MIDDQNLNNQEETQEDQNTPVSENLQSEILNEEVLSENNKDVNPTPEEEKSLEESAKLDENVEETEKEIVEEIVKEDDDTKTSVTEPLKSKSDDKRARWYVVHTYSGHEAKVAATLKQKVESLKIDDKVLDILVPTQEKIEIKEGKKSKVNEKIFPGYLLIKMILDDDTWLAVRTTQGITSFVGVANRPTPLPEEEVATIQRFMTMEAPKFKTSFSIGEAVKIVDGPFSEFLGSISEIDEEKGTLKVLVSIFGRETPVELDFLQVNKL